MTKNLLLLTCAAGALTLAAGVGQAAAATAAANAAAADQETGSVTELVVTAEKRETSLQRVPVAVSVFTGAQRDAIGINTVADVTNFAPGFSYDPANVHAYIRGIGRQSVNVTDDQRVANYEDEFYVYSPYGLDKSSLFLSQEQIERGPQSVGGREAPGGSIDMISVRPTDQPYGEIRATVANFGTENIEGAFSTQLAPGLDVRVAGYDHNQNDGYFHNLSGGKSEGGVAHEYYLEGQVDWKPSDQFEFWGRGFISGWNNRGDAGSRVGFANGSFDETNLTDANAYVGGGLFINPNFGYAAPNGNPTANAAANGVHAVFGSLAPVPTSVTLINGNVLNNPGMNNPYQFISPLERDVTLNGYDDFNYIATYHGPGFDIKYNGGVQGYNYDLNYNGTDTGVRSFTLPSLGFPGTTPLTINPLVASNYIEDDWWTAHDLTIESTTDAPLQWTAGAFYYFQHYNQPYSVSDPQQPQLTHPLNLAGAPAPSNAGNRFLYLDYKFDVQTVAGYGQVSYKFNDQFRVTGDVRYSWDDKTGTENARYVAFNSTFLESCTPGLPSIGGSDCINLATSGVQPGVPLYLSAGAATPSFDITSLETCLTGTANTKAHPNACNTGPLAPGVKSIGVILPNGYAQRQLGITDGEVTGGAKLEWTPTPDIFTYASYSHGYASPSFNAGLVSAAPEVSPEFINAYEIGYKQSIGRTLLVDVAAFYYDYDNFQQPISIANGSVTSSEFINVPKARSDGIEFEGYWTPTRDLNVTLSYSFDDTAVLTKCTGAVAGGVLTPSPGALCLVDTNDPNALARGARPFPGQNAANPRDQNVSGDPLPDAPRNKVAVSVAYTWHYDPGDLTLSSAYVWRDQQAGTVFDRWYDNAPAWSDVDIRALWKGPHDRYEVIGYVKNVFNSLQYTVGAQGVGLAGNSMALTSASAGLFQQNLFELNPPRTYGLEVRYKFF